MTVYMAALMRAAPGRRSAAADEQARPKAPKIAARDIVDGDHTHDQLPDLTVDQPQVREGLGDDEDGADP